MFWVRILVDAGYRPGNTNFELLLVGYFEADKLMFAGKVRQGLNPAIRAGVFKTIKHLRAKKFPFRNLSADMPRTFSTRIIVTIMTTAMMMTTRPRRFPTRSSSFWRGVVSTG